MPKRRQHSLRGGAVDDSEQLLVGHDDHFLTPLKSQKHQVDAFEQGKVINKSGRFGEAQHAEQGVPNLQNQDMETNESQDWQHDAMSSDFESQAPQLDSYETSDFEGQDSQVQVNPSDFEEQDMQVDANASDFEEQDMQVDANASDFEEQDMQVDANPSDFEEQDSQVNANASDFEEQDKQVETNPSDFEEQDMQVDANPSDFEEQDMQVEANPPDFDKQDSHLEANPPDSFSASNAPGYNDVKVEDMNEEKPHTFSSTNYFEMNPVEQKLARLMLQQHFADIMWSEEAKRERAHRLFRAQYEVENAKQFCKVVGSKVIVARPFERTQTYFQIWLNLCCEYVMQETKRFEEQGAEALGQEWATKNAHAIRQMYNVISSSLLLSKVKTKIPDLEQCVYAIDPSLRELVYDEEYQDDDLDGEHEGKQGDDYFEDDSSTSTNDNQKQYAQEEVGAFCQAQECQPGETVTSCYKKNALHKHPDKNGRTQDFQELNSAYHDLKDQHLDKELC